MMDILDTEKGTEAWESKKGCFQRMTNYISEENMGVKIVNDYFVVKRKNNEGKIPGVRAGAWPKRWQASTAGCVRRYERHPDLLLVVYLRSSFLAQRLFCVLRLWFITIVVRKRCTLSLCSCCCQIKYCPLYYVCPGYDVKFEFLYFRLSLPF